jgi:hypothetical protein
VGEIYHAHLLILDGSKIERDVVHKAAGKRDQKQTVIPLDGVRLDPSRRTMLAVVTQAYRNFNPEVETLIPPSLFVVELLPRSEAAGVLSSQRFAYHVKGKDPFWVVPAPNTSVNHIVSMISLGGQDVSGFYLAQQETSFNALFRVALRERGKGTIHQKACLYPFRADTTPDQAGLPIMRVVDPQGKVSARIPASPRPKVWTSGKQARTEADLFASFYGLAADAKYKFVNFFGYADEANVRYEPETINVDVSRKTHTRRIAMPTKDPVVVVVGHQLAAMWEPKSKEIRHNVIQWESNPRAIKPISVLDSPFDWISFLGAEDQPSDGIGGMGYASLAKMAGAGPWTSSIVDPSTDPTLSGSNSGALSGQGQGQGQGQGNLASGKGQGSATANPTINFNPNISLICGCGGSGKGPRPDLDGGNSGYIPTPGGWSYPTPESPVPYGPYGPSHSPSAPPYQYPGTSGKSIP